jgi:hypothetical protein
MNSRAIALCHRYTTRVKNSSKKNNLSLPSVRAITLELTGEIINQYHIMTNEQINDKIKEARSIGIILCLTAGLLVD